MRSGLGNRGAALRDLGALLRRRWWVIAVCVVLLPGAAYLYSSHLSKTYSANITVDTDIDATQLSPTGQESDAKAYSAFLLGYTTLPQVYGATVKSLRRPVGSVTDLSATVDPDTGWLVLTATATAPQVAVDAANAYATVLGQYTRASGRRQLQQQINGTRQGLKLIRDPEQRRTAQDQIASMTALVTVATRQLHTVAATGAEVASPHPGRNALLALILALLIAPALVVGVDRLDRTVRRPTEVERVARAKLLAGVPRQAFGSGLPGPDVAPVFQRLRDSLVYFDPDRPLHTVAIASPLGGEGRTTVAVGVAEAFARSGRRAVLVDGDLNGRGIAARVGVPAAPGLTDVLAGHDLAAALPTVATGEGELTVLPAGTPSPLAAELLGSDYMFDLLDRLSAQFDFVLIDTAPALEANGTLALLARTSGTIVVARLHHTRREPLARMRRLTEAAHTRVVGVVATGARRERAPKADAYSGPTWSDAGTRSRRPWVAR